MPDWKNTHGAVGAVKIKNLRKGRKLAQKIVVSQLNTLWNAGCSGSEYNGSNFIFIDFFTNLLVKNAGMFFPPELPHLQNLIKAVELYISKLVFIKGLVLGIDDDYIFEGRNLRKTFAELSKYKRIFNADCLTFGKAEDVGKLLYGNVGSTRNITGSCCHNSKAHNLPFLTVIGNMPYAVASFCSQCSKTARKVQHLLRKLPVRNRLKNALQIF